MHTKTEYLSPGELRARLSVLTPAFAEVIEQAEQSGRQIAYESRRTPFGNFPISARLAEDRASAPWCISDEERSINREQVEEIEPHRFLSEASALGFAPGEWPKRLRLGRKFGNGNALLLEGSDGDSALYRQDAGCIELRILND